MGRVRGKILIQKGIKPWGNKKKRIRKCSFEDKKIVDSNKKCIFAA